MIFSQITMNIIFTYIFIMNDNFCKNITKLRLLVKRSWNLNN